MRVLAQGFTLRGPEGRWGHARPRSRRPRRAPPQNLGCLAAALLAGGRITCQREGQFWRNFSGGQQTEPYIRCIS